MTAPVALTDLNELASDPDNPPVDISEGTADVPFADLGMDSFSFIEFLDRIEVRYGVAVPDEDVQTLTTPRQLLDYLTARLGGR